MPLTSEEIATNANLYFNPETEVFYCVVQEFEKYGQSITRVYSLSNPPVSLAAVKYYDTQSNSSGKASVWPYFLILSFMVVVGGVFVVMKRKPAVGKEKKHAGTDTEATIPDSATVPIPASSSSGEEENKHNGQEEPFLADTITIRNNSIFLFGTFAAIDKNGRDMTYMFSPKIRHLFL